jgi:UDP-N-acetylglucosamine--N-acetylmuramyl-(pentapeptide) pyrophosphoryl-undecaprenol N-acetylglucosamine transferase
MTATGGFLIAGGGTGGHVFPALALADELRRRRPDASIVFVGTRSGLEADLVPRAGWLLEFVRAKGIVGKGPGARLRGLAALPLAFSDSMRLLSRHEPSAVVGVGGYSSGPVVATAWARRVPTVIHESNAVPGLTNRLLARVATRVAAGTPAAAAALPGSVVTGNPVREAFFRVPSLVARPKERRFRVLVVGGSQGAQVLNRVLPQAFADLERRGLAFDAVHQAGKGRADAVAGAYREQGLGPDRVTVAEFLDDMPAAFAAADLVVARSGAMTAAEVAAAGRPALFVPFAAATHGHQEANARALAEAGAAIVVLEPDAGPARVADEVAGLVADPVRLLAMGEAARRAAVPGAAARLADVVLNAARRTP